MNYTGLRRIRDAAHRRRVVGGLSRLRSGLASEVAAKKNGSFLLATWNIREFGGTKFGGRLIDAMYYIAECISRFDLVAIQEVRANLQALRGVLRILGPEWTAIFTDVSYAKGGNMERLAFVYNKTKVGFTGLAGELVLPEKPEDQNRSSLVSQIARTPFICGVQVGWAKFNLCTVHIYYGKGVATDPRRLEEIETLAALLAKKAKDYINTKAPIDYSPEHLVLLGDFNIFKRSDATFEALSRSGFDVPTRLRELPEGSNVPRNKFYDQIAFFKQKVGIENTAAGIFDFYKYVFNDPGEFAAIENAPAADGFSDWRTYQMSDHLIMWSEFSVDSADAYLKALLDADE